MKSSSSSPDLSYFSNKDIVEEEELVRGVVKANIGFREKSGMYHFHCCRYHHDIWPHHHQRLVCLLSWRKSNLKI